MFCLLWLLSLNVFYLTEQEEAQRLRAELNIHVSGAPSSSLPAPCTSFSALARLGLPPPLLADIARLGFEAPTPIQAQALPVVLAGIHSLPLLLIFVLSNCSDKL